MIIPVIILIDPGSTAFFRLVFSTITWMCNNLDTVFNDFIRTDLIFGIGYNYQNRMLRPCVVDFLLHVLCRYFVIASFSVIRNGFIRVLKTDNFAIMTRLIFYIQIPWLCSIALNIYSPCDKTICFKACKKLLVNRSLYQFL